MPIAVVVVIFTVRKDDFSVLLIEPAAEPSHGSRALLGGLLLEGESLDGAAIRKLADETGVSDVYLEQLYTFDRLGEWRPSRSKCRISTRHRRLSSTPSLRVGARHRPRPGRLDLSGPSGCYHPLVVRPEGGRRIGLCC